MRQGFEKIFYARLIATYEMLLVRYSYVSGSSAYPEISFIYSMNWNFRIGASHAVRIESPILGSA